MLTVSYPMDHRAPSGGARESNQGTTQYSPELVFLAVYVSEDGLVGHQRKERPTVRANFICLSTGERQGQEVGVRGYGSGCGRVWATFGIALEM